MTGTGNTGVDLKSARNVGTPLGSHAGVAPVARNEVKLNRLVPLNSSHRLNQVRRVELPIPHPTLQRPAAAAVVVIVRKVKY